MKSFAEIFRSHCEFDQHGRHRNGTDKQSNHFYGDAYESLFPDRSIVKLMLEVGVAGGASLLAWREIFEDATIVGMDIEPCAARGQHRVECHIGDQRVKADCERVIGGRRFDFICEDAYHSTENTLLTLFWLWPFVKPGGIYVVEEWHNIHADLVNVKSLFPCMEIVDTIGPSGGHEPLVVMRKP